MIESIIERINLIKMDEDTDEASAFHQLFFNKDVHNELIDMTYKALPDPQAFTMSDFLPMFSTLLVYQQAKFVKTTAALESSLQLRKHLLEVTD